jgi:hypothetical protein
MVFGVVAHAFYGTEGFIEQTWIDIVFWTLIGTGIGVSTIQMFGSCVPCRLSRRFHVEAVSQVVCERLNCVH